MHDLIGSWQFRIQDLSIASPPLSSELPCFCFQCLIYLSLIYSKLLSQSFYEDSNSKDYKGIFFYLGLLLGKIIKENQNLDLLI